MATEIRVPTLGESVSEATIGKWFKKVGDAIAADEPLVELETDKVTIEVPAPAAGTLLEITAQEGDTVGVSALLGAIAEGAGAAAKPAAKPDAVAQAAGNSGASTVKEAVEKTARIEAEGGPVRKLMNDIKAVDWVTLDDALARLSREYERAFLTQVGPIAIAAAGLASSPAPEPTPTLAAEEIDAALQTLTPAEAASVDELRHGLLQKVKSWLRGEA